MRGKSGSRGERESERKLRVEERDKGNERGLEDGDVEIEKINVYGEKTEHWRDSLAYTGIKNTWKF